MPKIKEYHTLKQIEATNSIISLLPAVAIVNLGLYLIGAIKKMPLSRTRRSTSRTLCKVPPRTRRRPRSRYLMHKGVTS